MMSTLIDYLEELADSDRVITVPADEVDRLAERFGDRVRQMGQLNMNNGGSLEIPVSVIRDAATQLESQSLLAAVQELKSERFAELIDRSATSCLIEKISENYRGYFRDLMTRYQETTDPLETTRLRDQLLREVFGS